MVVKTHWRIFVRNRLLFFLIGVLSAIAVFFFADIAMQLEDLERRNAANYMWVIVLVVVLIGGLAFGTATKRSSHGKN